MNKAIFIEWDTVYVFVYPCFKTSRFWIIPEYKSNLDVEMDGGCLSENEEYGEMKEKKRWLKGRKAK